MKTTKVAISIFYCHPFWDTSSWISEFSPKFLRTSLPKTKYGKHFLTQQKRSKNWIHRILLSVKRTPAPCVVRHFSQVRTLRNSRFTGEQWIHVSGTALSVKVRCSVLRNSTSWSSNYQGAVYRSYEVCNIRRVIVRSDSFWYGVFVFDNFPKKLSW